MTRHPILPAAWLALTAGTTLAQVAQDHAFTYQGRLTDGGNPATGVYDLQLKLFDADSGGTQTGPTLEIEDVQVTDGLFTARADFGAAVFTGQKFWLEVGVREGAGVGAYTELAPRNELTGTPYASCALFPWEIGSGQISYAGGYVGIGTASPATALTVQAIGYGIEHTDGTRRLGTYTSATGGWFGTLSPDPLHLFTNDGVSRLTVGVTGGIGIGTTAPIAKLHVADNVSVTHLVETTGGTNAWARTTFRTLNGDWSVGTSQNFINDIFYIYRGGAAAVALAVHPNGNVGIGTSAPIAPLDVNGIARVKTLQITGGGDIAEPFDVASPGGPPRPGHVVVIDETRPGGLRVSDGEYDTKVAGVISGANGLAPGMVLRAEDRTDANGEHAVAMTGRVWCFVDASFGAIAPGDRLTTSPTAGHAMRAGDPARADGAVIGKAMTPLAEGRAMVLVLVNLQWYPEPIAMTDRMTIIALGLAALFVNPALAQQPAARRGIGGFGPFAQPIAPPAAFPDDLTPGFKLIDGDIQVPIDFDPFLDGLYATNPWTNNTVPYEFSANVPAADQARALAAFAQWTALSGVAFVIRTTQANYVRIQLSTGNSSAVGMVGALQNLNIAANQPVSVISHEVGHLLGLFHEHQRPDRGAFVQINQGNVQAAHWTSNYPVISAGIFGPYDFGSLMHYDRCAFSIGCCAGCTCVCTPGQQTITVLQPFTAQWQNMIGTATAPSYFDGIIARGFYPYIGDRWIDAAYVGIENGTFVQPWNDTFNAGFGFTPVNGTLLMKPGYYSGIGVYAVPKTIVAPAGGVTIGS